MLAGSSCYFGRQRLRNGNFRTGLHRLKLLWEDPLDNKYDYLPFGNGPWIYVGAGFAIRESLIILATLLARFRFSPSLSSWCARHRECRVAVSSRQSRTTTRLPGWSLFFLAGAWSIHRPMEAAFD